MVSNPVTIRRLTSSDLPVLELFFPQPRPDAHQVRIAKQDQDIYCYSGLVAQGKIVAIILIRWRGPLLAQHRKLSTYPEISAVYVLPAYRRQGFAMALLRDCEAQIVERGYAGAGLIIKDENTISIHMHTTCGYEPVGKARPTRQDPDKPRTYYLKRFDQRGPSE